jgi:FkbM family methyltransferase
VRLAVDLRPARPIRGDVSQNGEYSFLRWLLPESWPHSLVEVGANDGVTFSNSRNLLLEGWRGVLIEPHPDTFAKLAANTVDTDAILFNCAASSDGGEAPLFEDTATDGARLMATLSTDDNPWFDRTRSERSIPVRLRRLDEILDEAKFDTDFTLLSIDTEGHDASVLGGLGAYRPRVVMTERYLRKVEVAVAKQSLLTAMGYLYTYRLACNEVYIHRNWLLDLPHVLD